MLWVDVILPLPLPERFTYRVPAEMQEHAAPGKRAIVPLGTRKIYTGIITAVRTAESGDKRVRTLLDIPDEHPVITPVQMPFWKWIADYYLCNEGEVVAAALPSALRLESESLIEIDPDFDGEIGRFDHDGIILIEALMAQERMTLKEAARVIGHAKVVNLLRTLTEAGVLRRVEEVRERFRPRKERIYSLHPSQRSEEALAITMDALGKRAFRQLEVLMLMVAHLRVPDGPWEGTVPIAAFRSLKGYQPVLRQLEAKGILIGSEQVVSRWDHVEATRDLSEISLTDIQQQAYTELRQSYTAREVALLHGVTGSGKTEIYIKLIGECLEEGKQALYLLPEIALTTQIIERLRKYFGDRVGIYHSRYSEAERAEMWKEVLEFNPGSTNARYQVILGARSALLLPFNHLGLIIVDEEHDSSYKQVDPAPRYHARDAAIYLARLHGSAVVLGSATPAIETYANAKAGTFRLVSLAKRYQDVLLPEVFVADIREERRKRTMQSHFSGLLMQHASSALENGEQIILFQNRRGFSLRLECDQCNWMPRCRNCDVTLIYHKGLAQVKCHYCGYMEALPKQCPECGSARILMQGFGTEKVEEEIRDLLPQARIRRMDLDTTRSRTAYQRIIQEFENHQIDILVGTQMVTKGLDFDRVSTVGILNADNMLSFPDFRASERSFQLMAQVSGRSGRKKRGSVVIQTVQPYHAIIRQVIDHDYEAMFNDQMQERRQFGYPPFTRLIRIRLKHRDDRLTGQTAHWLADTLRTRLGKRVLGPEYPMVARIRNEYIRHILIKVEREASVKEAKRIITSALAALQKEPLYRRVRAMVDVDPY